jgi:NAD(P) transhydrogenase subunit alpha
MYSRNLTTLLRSLVKEGQLTLDLGDEVVAETLVTHKGKVVQARVKDLIAGICEFTHRDIDNFCVGDVCRR